MLLTPEQVDLLPIEELRPLIKTLLAEFELLRQRVADLEAENERLRQRLDKSTNSRNSSQPPSRDQKTNKSEKKRRKPGPPFGRRKFSRLLVDNPYLNDERSAMTPQGFQRQVTLMENQLDQLLEKSVRSEAARKLRDRFTTH